MKKFLLPENGDFYKGNMHTHSVISDGSNTPEELKEIYKSKGYSVLAITDHDVMIDHSDLNDPEFLTITSYEVETNKDCPGMPFSKIPTYHLNFYAKDPNETYYPCANPRYTFANSPKYVQDYYKGDYERKYTVECQNEMIREAKAHGFLVSYNHPAWSLQSYPDYAGLEGMDGLEVYNHSCFAGGYQLDGAGHVLEDLLRLGKRVYPMAGDDAHSTEYCGGGWVNFKAPALTYDNVMHAFEVGDFYASWGPDISALYIEDGIVKIDTTPAHSIYIISDGRYQDIRLDPNAELTHAEFNITDFLNETHALGLEKSAYIRLCVVDAIGACALTRAYFVDEIEK